MHHRQKTGKCANQIRKRIAQIADLPVDRKAAELMATYKLKSQPSQMLIDMGQSPEKLKWLDGCQHHFESPSLTTDFFFFGSPEKEKKVIQ